MGATSSKSYPQRGPQKPVKIHLTDFSLSSFVGKLSGRSFASASVRSTYSVSRPWSRVSRKTWRETTLTNPLECAKTAWPVPLTESIFLPEFKINMSKENDFEVLHLISKGAFGRVFKVVEKNSNSVFAMKVISKSKVLQDNCVNQVKDEVKIQSMCGHHPFIINSPQFWQDKRKLFIVSTHVVGGDLFHLIDKYGALPEEICQLYVAELASAIDFLHNAGVIYRDLKPENVLLDEDGHAVLIDFGLSKWLKYGTKTRTICGTLQYMAPEVFSLEGYSHSVDWWSLGVLAHYLLTSKYPFGGNTSTPGALPENLTYSSSVKDLLLRLLHPDPGKRLRSLHVLTTIPFFLGFNFSKARSKEISVNSLLEKHFPAGPPVTMTESEVIFLDFDSYSPVIV